MWTLKWKPIWGQENCQTWKDGILVTMLELLDQVARGAKLSIEVSIN